MRVRVNSHNLEKAKTMINARTEQANACPTRIIPLMLSFLNLNDRPRRTMNGAKKTIPPMMKTIELMKKRMSGKMKFMISLAPAKVLITIIAALYKTNPTVGNNLNFCKCTAKK